MAELIGTITQVTASALPIARRSYFTIVMIHQVPTAKVVCAGTSTIVLIQVVLGLDVLCIFIAESGEKLSIKDRKYTAVLEVCDALKIRIVLPKASSGVDTGSLGPT